MTMMVEKPFSGKVLSADEQDKLWVWARRQYSMGSCWHTLWLNGLPLGQLSPKWKERLRADWRGSVREDSDGLHVDCPDWDELGDRLQNMALQWRDGGILQGWRGEYFDVSDASGNTLFALERAAFRPLGLQSRAIHVNGLTLHDGWRFWIGRRSLDKAVDPGRLDNMVGGGVSAGETAKEAARRESMEEAGLGEDALTAMISSNCLHSLRPVSRGLHNEILYIFDVVLPPDKVPQNQDGEVAGFFLMDIPELINAVISGEMMDDSALVTLDAFRRFGLLDRLHPLSLWLEKLSRKSDSLQKTV